MIVLGWILSPLVTLLALLHTALSSIVGWWRWGQSKRRRLDDVECGRRFWSRPLLRWIVGAKLDIDIHPEAQALADAGKGVGLVANHAAPHSTSSNLHRLD